MARIRTDNVFGTVTDNPLLVGATSLNSNGLANLAAVAAPDEAIIILDPNKVNGAPEIVVVTAHTASATVATIARGQFGTAAREHPQGTEWVHGPIASNTTTFVTQADDQGDYPPLGEWEAYTPALSNLTLGNGSVVGVFIRIGRTIHYRILITLGSTSVMGTSPSFTLPVTPATNATSPSAGGIFGLANYLDVGVINYPGFMEYGGGGGSIVRFRVYSASGSYATGVSVTATVPFVWVNGDALSAWGTYEAAS